MKSCLENKLCEAFSFDRLNRWANNCWLKEAAEGFKAFSGLTTGARCDFEKAPQSTPDGVFPETGSYFILTEKTEIFSVLEQKLASYGVQNLDCESSTVNRISFGIETNSKILRTIQKLVRGT